MNKTKDKEQAIIICQNYELGWKTLFRLVGITDDILK